MSTPIAPIPDPEHLAALLANAEELATEQDSRLLRVGRLERRRLLAQALLEALRRGSPLSRQ